MGYVAYDAAYALERLPAHHREPPPAGYLWAGVYDWVLARDESDGTGWIVASPLGDRDPDACTAGLRVRLAQGPTQLSAPRVGAPQCDTDAAAYGHWVSAVKDYIAAGDCYQVNIARRIDLRCGAAGLALFQALAAGHPSPYGAYLSAGRLELVGASPELFLHVRDGEATARPIKGTRARGRSTTSDQALARALRRSPKDRAENVMIVDVMRNDFGRVCRPGSVNVPALWETEAHPSVWQLVSEVRGELAADASAADLLRVCSPSGSVTGAPKIRAMEIIDELEPVRRGAYCGSVFAYGFDGSLISSVAIRTLQINDGQAHLHVGSGVVADSSPDREYAETADKARGILAALGVRE